MRPGPGRTNAGPILEQLSLHIGELRSGGHDAIFASLVLRVLRDHPELSTPKVVEGVVHMLRDFVETQRAWRPTRSH